VTLLLPQIEELDALLLKLPGLVDAVEREDLQALDAARGWLVEIEGAFERNRLAPETAAIAALRAELRMAALGAAPPTLRFAGQLKPRRIREATLLDALRRAQQAVAAALTSTLAEHEEAERLTRQLVALARHKGVTGSAVPGPGNETGLRQLWQVICSDSDMTTGTVRVLGLVGEADALALLDRALSTA